MLVPRFATHELALVARDQRAAGDLNAVTKSKRFAIETMIAAHVLREPLRAAA